MSANSLSFTGWLRSGRAPWRPVASGSSEAEVNRRLQAAAALHQRAATLVLPAGAPSPNERTRGRLAKQ